MGNGKINKEREAAMPQKLIKEILEYDGVTGGWIWIKKTHPNSPIKVGQAAGCLDKDGGYVCIMINGHSYQAHRLAWAYTYGDYPDGEQPFIDHINGKRADNRIENLRVSSHCENDRNKKMHSDNTSGVTGVYREERIRPSGKIYAIWRACWQNENGKQQKKNFNVEKLGEEVAKLAAISYRVEQIRLLELNHGIVYSERHGN